MTRYTHARLGLSYLSLHFSPLLSFPQNSLHFSSLIQITHPQKRRLIRHVLDGTMGRLENDYSQHSVL